MLLEVVRRDFFLALCHFDLQRGFSAGTMRDIGAPGLAAAIRRMGNWLSQALNLLGVPQAE